MKQQTTTKFGIKRLLMFAMLTFAIILPFSLPALSGNRVAMAEETDDSGIVRPADITSSATNGLKKHINVGYYLCGNGKDWYDHAGSPTAAMLAKPDKKLREIDDAWDVINVAFLETENDKYTPKMTLDLHNGYDPIVKLKTGEKPPRDDDPDQQKRIAEFIKDIKLMQDRGKKIVLSIGGANGHLSLDTDEKRDFFTSKTIEIIEKYGFDGIDIDLEQTSISALDCRIGETDSNASAKNLVYLIKTLKKRFSVGGKDFIISAAPEAAYVYIYEGSNQDFASFLPVVDAVRDELTYIHPQIYNFCFEICNANVIPERYRVAHTNTLEGYIKTSRYLIDGFPSKRGYFKKLRADQVAFGVPAVLGAAAVGSFTGTDAYVAALDALIKEYPTYRGIMTWSIQHDDISGDILYGEKRFSKAIGDCLKKHNALYDNAKTPEIMAQPVDRECPPGGKNSQLSVEASGIELSYQWYEAKTKTNMGGTKIEKATDADFDAPTTAVGTKYYYCEVKSFDQYAVVNQSSVTRTRAVSVTVKEGAEDNAWVRGKAYKKGDVVVHNKKTWCADWDISSEEPGTNIWGAWKPYTVTPPIDAQTPNITVDAQDKKIGKGGNATLSVTAEVQSGKLTYQWYSTDSPMNLNGNKIKDAANSTYTAPNNADGTKYYFCEITNTDNSGTITGQHSSSTFSRIAKLTIGEGDVDPIPKVGWSKGKVYAAGEILSGEGRYFRALKRNQGKEPSANLSDWEELTPQAIATIKNAAVPYADGKKYNSLTVVSYGGKYYQATRYATKAPTTLNGWREIA